MAYRPAQIYTGTGWDDIGDPRVGTVQTDVSTLQGQVPGKIDYATPRNNQNGSGASAYTFVLADATRLTVATNAAAKTFTIPPQSAVTWVADTIIRVVNTGAGALTVAGGSGVTVTNTAKTIAQFEAAAAIRTGSNAWTLVPFGSGEPPPPPPSVEYIVIAGGGAGGKNGGNGAQPGGGGAGGYRSSVIGESSGGGTSAASPLSVSVNTEYRVIIGAGGGTDSGGSATSFFNISTVGGGRGSTVIGSNWSGSSGGGSGGGGGPFSGGAAGTAGQGFAGGNFSSNGGGGGGAGGAGSPGVRGNGVSSNITGSSVTRALGGTTNTNTAGAANTGGGGGGGTTGSAGGSGVVLVRHLDIYAKAFSTATVTQTGGYFIYQFNSSGTMGWSS